MSILESVIADCSPDVILLQEIKCTDDKFPYMELESLGYNISVHGQKSYNGVAIMSKSPMEDVVRGIPEFDDDHSRYIECVTTIRGLTMRVGSVYVPNGQDAKSEKFTYKLEFFKALRTHFQNMRKHEEVFLIGGDYNVAPEAIDVYDSKKLDGRIGFHIEERKALRSIISDGFYDSFRTKHPNSQEFSWWDYRRQGLAADEGMRIDHILTSPEATDRLFDSKILKQYRIVEKASDHTPVVCELHEYTPLT